MYFDANGDGLMGDAEPAATITSGAFALAATVAASQLGTAYVVPAPGNAQRVVSGSWACSACRARWRRGISCLISCLPPPPLPPCSLPD